MTINAKSIVRKIDNEHVKLEKVHGHGYWIFIYDDPENNVFEDESVYVPSLNMMSHDRWVETGREFVKKVEKLIEERKAFK